MVESKHITVLLVRSVHKELIQHSNIITLRVNDQPNVVVLMATYNGSPWLEQQIYSVLKQVNVNVKLVISDDNSNDDTPAHLKSFAEKDQRIMILPRIARLGAAGKNFYRLILNSDINGFDYIAFADQDDIWHEAKLDRHIALAKIYQADGVSSNITAFWPDDTCRLVVKSQAQKKYDFLFESAGPGCTFLMTPWLIDQVRELLNNEQSLARQIALHDWLCYAVCRAKGRHWVIDREPSVDYRQHSTNVFGANIGLKAKWTRLAKLKQGWYREEVNKICQVASTISDDSSITKIAQSVNTKNLISQIRLLYFTPHLRRKFLDRLVLFFLILCFIF